jgi:HK97 family phage prohead protease
MVNNYKMEKEVRILNDDTAEIRAGENSRMVSGTGIVFNSESNDLGGFKEIIRPSAINNVLDKSDVLMLLNHNIGRGVLARSSKGKGSLKLVPTTKGVKYTFEAPAFALGDELIEGIKRGDIRGSSFSFTVTKDGETWEKRGGQNIRTISQFNAIYDISAVYRPAYPSTEIALRKMAEFEREMSAKEKYLRMRQETFRRKLNGNK